jgi:hypothetical protein
MSPRSGSVESMSNVSPMGSKIPLLLAESRNAGGTSLTQSISSGISGAAGGQPCPLCYTPPSRSQRLDSYAPRELFAFQADSTERKFQRDE